MNATSRIGAALLALVPANLRPLAKAAVPGIGTLVAVGLETATTGVYDKVEVTTTVTGLVAVLLTYLVPNAKRR